MIPTRKTPIYLRDVLVSKLPSEEEKYSDADLYRQADRALRTLTRREEMVLRMYFGIGMDSHGITEIATHFFVTRERVFQIQAKALMKLRNNYSILKILKTFIET